MIEIANWVANFFLLALGVLFFGIGMVIIIGLSAGVMDFFRRPFIPKSKRKADVG